MADLNEVLPGFNEQRAIRLNLCPICGQIIL